MKNYIKSSSYSDSNDDVSKVSPDKLHEILDSADCEPDYRPLGLFYAKEGNCWVAIDNSDGCALTEEFYTEGEAVSWLRGEFEVSDILDTPNKGLPDNILFSTKITDQESYIQAYGTIGEWWDNMQSDTDYIVLEEPDGTLIWEGNMWDLPDDEYFDYKILDILYDGGGTCILTVEG